MRNNYTADCMSMTLKFKFDVIKLFFFLMPLMQKIKKNANQANFYFLSVPIRENFNWMSVNQS